MKNKKMKIGAVMALLGSVATAAVCVANTQLSSKANSIVDGAWDVNMNDIIKDGKDIKGLMNVEMYEVDSHKAIKLCGSNDISMDNGAIMYTLGTKYDGRVRIETIGARALKDKGYVRGKLCAQYIVNIDESALENTGITQLTIDAVITKYINNYACANCQYLESIVVDNAEADIIPNIKDNSFINCKNLKKIHIGYAVENETIRNKWVEVANRIGNNIQVVY